MSYRLNNSVIRDSKGRVKFKRVSSGGYEHYHIGVWLEADNAREMDRVQSVEYELHTSFSNRTRRSRNRTNDFSITFWSWGTFVIHAKIYLVGSEDPVEIAYDLVYDLPQDDESNYVDVSPSNDGDRPK